MQEITRIFKNLFTWNRQGDKSLLGEIFPEGRGVGLPAPKGALDLDPNERDFAPEHNKEQELAAKRPPLVPRHAEGFDRDLDDTAHGNNAFNKGGE